MDILRHIRISTQGFRWIGLLFVAFLTLGSASSLSAQVSIDPTSCGHFETWEDAQAALKDPATTNAENLDPDSDGVACESAFGVGDGDIPADQMSCSNFESQEAAQAHYDASGASQRDILDPDGDGTACEDAFEQEVDEEPAESGAIAALPSTGAGPGEAATLLPLLAIAAATLVVATSVAIRRPSSPSRMI